MVSDDDESGEFWERILERISKFEGRFDRLDSAIDGLVDTLEKADARLNAIVARLAEQDAAYDRLNEKVDRLASAVRDSLVASEQALNAITPLSRRITRLEQPGDR